MTTEPNQAALALALKRRDINQAFEDAKAEAESQIARAKDRVAKAGLKRDDDLAALNEEAARLFFAEHQLDEDPPGEATPTEKPPRKGSKARAEWDAAQAAKVGGQ